MNVQQSIQSAQQKIQAGQFAEAEAIYRRVIATDSTLPEAHNDYGNVLCELGRHVEAIESYQRAINLRPTYTEAFINFGNALRAMGQPDPAIMAYQMAVRLSPLNVLAICNLGTAHLDKWQVKEAIDCYAKAISIQPDYVTAYCNLGSALERAGNREGAARAYEKAIRLDPQMASPHCNLAGVLLSAGRVDDALRLARRAVELNPRMPEVRGNLGNALWMTGRSDLAVDSYRVAAELAPQNPAYLSNISYISYFDPRCDIQTIRDATQKWARQFAAPLKDFILPHDNDRNPDRPLRVGYVSQHFKAHAEAAFILPLLENHDKSQIELFCYSDVIKPDAVTQRIEAAASSWQPTRALNDHALAGKIRADKIDILVDLTMHMAGSRLMCFARKPAPIQIAYLAYPGTTGLPTIDYRLTDSFVDPEGMFQDHYTETCVKLPRTFACYNPEGMEGTPKQPQSSPISPSPSNLGEGRGEGPLSFGSLNNSSKINNTTLDLWAGALNAIPDSTLRVLCPSREGRSLVVNRLAEHGIDASRLIFLPKQNRPQYLEEYTRIDICLDTLPYCGHTTTLDSLWMGVPMITRIGSTAAGRVGWSIYNNLQLMELAAHTDADFTRIAIELASDRPRLAELHRTLRQRLQSSPLMDGPAFARDIEFAYRRIWRQWALG
jgi:predicted O-linked N-acetylglucosamine transferase (SPINDLY family)